MAVPRNFVILCISAAAVAGIMLVSTVTSCRVPKNLMEFEWNPTEVEPEGYYFPMGSLNRFSWNTQNLTLPGVSRKCPVRLIWSPDSNQTVFNGCGKELRFQCNQVDEKLWKFDCKHLMSNDSYVDLSHNVYGTLTDKKTFAFINRCFYNIQQEDWIVFSTSKDLPSTTKFEILVHAAVQDYWARKL